jgi:hypothetical protein
LLKKDYDIEVLNKKNLEKDAEMFKLKEQVSELKEELSSKSIENLVSVMSNHPSSSNVD